MLDPRTWSRRTLVLLCLLAAVPAVLGACSSSSDPQCPDGQVLSAGECVNAQL